METTQEAPRSFVLMFGGVFALAGLGALWMGVSEYLKASQVSKWPTVSGRIEQSGAAFQGPHDPSESRATLYAANVHYKYEVDGRQYSGRRIAHGSIASSDRSLAQEEAEKYPVGSEVAVYYNPEDPGDAALESNVGWILAVPFAIGLVMAAAGGLVLRYGLRMPKT